MSVEKRKVSLLLNVLPAEAVEGEQGLYVTRLFHPKLSGELSFYHSEHAGREEVLKALDENLVGGIMGVVNIIGDLVDGFSKTTNPTSSSTKVPGDTTGSSR